MTLKARTALFLALAGVAAAVQPAVVRGLFAFSRADESASHLVLIPIVSAGLVWYRREKIFSSVQTAPVSGLLLVLLGIAAAIMTALSGLASGSQSWLMLRVAALLVVWAGAFLLVFGSAAFVRARFALAFLLFTIPIPTVLLDGATELLKRGSTEVAGTLFSLSGAPFHREGFEFALPGIVIRVADECSGIRSTIALVLTALLAGHMFLDDAWKKAVLVLAILPITIFKNGVRIVTLGLLASYVDPGILSSRLHRDGGALFFILALVLLAPLLALLRPREIPVTQPDLSEKGAR